MYPTTFQNRLDLIHSRIARKIIDNKLRLSGSLTDTLVINRIKNKEGDVLTYRIKDHLIVPVVWPELKEVPYRSLHSANGAFTLTSLVNAFDESETKNYKVSIPHKYHLEVGNLLFRVFLDDDYEYPAVLGLEIAETLGDFTLNMLVQSSYQTVLYTEDLPDELINIIGEYATRRQAVGY